MTKQKRMIYIYEENVEFYDNLENKSIFINEALKDGRIRKSVVEQTNTNNIDYVRQKVAEMDAARKAGQAQ